jgi:predicted naringenin-chalcone synthase
MLIDIATSVPPYKVTQERAAEELKRRMTGNPAVGRFIDMACTHSGIDQRFIVIPDADENSTEKFFSPNGVLQVNNDIYIKPDTAARMNEYEKWSKMISKNAVQNLFVENNIDPSTINRIITISCTGFFAPGLDYYLINEFNLPLNVKRISIGFMGCAAALVGLNSVFEAMNALKNSSSVKRNKKNTLMVAIELCSLHLQFEASKDNILANMIFADGCAAALFSDDIPGNSKTHLEIIWTESVLFENSAEYMGWKVGSFGFEMMLSSDLPKIIFEKATLQLKKIIESRKIKISDIKHWALHPGGRAIIDSLQKGLDLNDEQMLASRTVLKNYGNMSSASILFVLKEILKSDKIQNGDLCCAVAFGPGLTMEVVLLKGK